MANERADEDDLARIVENEDGSGADERATRQCDPFYRESRIDDRRNRA
jgi:hypothetical protein